ncbi:MAG: sporulation integral membrane protein YtvI [Oscillospiraceae bacterium]|nr:sporulation integral membrane protein YtvI [Oscillospiraceae bacterium]
MDAKIEKRVKFLVNLVYYAVLAALVFLALRYAIRWLMPFFLGFSIAFITRAPADFVSKRTRMSRRVCGAGAVIFLYAAAGLIFYFAGARTIVFLTETVNNIPEFFEENINPAIEYINGIISNFIHRITGDTQQSRNILDGISNGISDFVASSSGGFIKYITELGTKLPSIMIWILFAVISSILMSMDYDKITGFIRNKIPPDRLEKISKLKRRCTDMLIGCFKAYSKIALITFAELSAGLFIIGAKNPVVTAILITLVDVLPVIGLGAIMIPWILVETLRGEYNFAMALGALYVVAVIVREIVVPKIVGKQLGLHPLVALIAVFAGLKLFGITGIIIAPVTAQVIADFLRKRDENKNHNGFTEN